jgi:phosphatidate cytidylyltransferase
MPINRRQRARGTGCEVLKTRVITALVLLAILLPALFYPHPGAFALVAWLLIGAAAWEWARLNNCAQAASLLIAAAALFICAAAWFGGFLERPLKLLWLLVGALWVLGGAGLLRGGVAGWPRLPQVLRLLVGVGLLVAAWLALVQARKVGIEFLLSVLVLVWAADICAYFAGRTWGGKFSRSKLAVSISPGKSWEGVWGGMAGVLLLGAAWIAFGSPDSLYARLFAQHGAAFVALAVVFLVAMSVVGDLVESLVKRSAGAKDSSRLLPGHGGVLDRIDALLPTLPLAMMLVSV